MIFIGGAEPAAVGLFPPPLDKVVHTLAYGLMLMLAVLSFPNIRQPVLFGLVIMVGVMDEIHQVYLPGRFAGLDDLMADILGCCLALLIFKVISILKSTHKNNS